MYHVFSLCCADSVLVDATILKTVHRGYTRGILNRLNHPLKNDFFHPKHLLIAIIQLFDNNKHCTLLLLYHKYHTLSSVFISWGAVELEVGKFIKLIAKLRPPCITVPLLQRNPPAARAHRCVPRSLRYI